jgi:HSP20 family molecular chaperone IbpA
MSMDYPDDYYEPKPHTDVSMNFQEADFLQHAINDAYGQAEKGSEVPAITLWIGDTDLLISTEMPGIAAKDIHVGLKGTVLRIWGTKGGAATVVDRSFTLPFPVSTQHIETGFSDGVLAIRLVRAA